MSFQEHAVSASKTPGPDRRDFLSHVATAAAMMAGTACAAPLAAVNLGAATVTGSRAASFDDSWTRRVAAAKH